MARALQLAKYGPLSPHPNPRVGCVIVKGNTVIGEGRHEFTGGPHAEIMALESTAGNARDADCYVSLEPCAHSGRTPPCTDAIIQSGIRRVISAMIDPNPEVSGKGHRALEQQGIITETGLLEAEARELNPGFIMRMQSGRPRIRCKLAMSLDGRTALKDGTSQWITSATAREDVQRLRAGSDAIVSGINTILADDPRLDVRLDSGNTRQPMRVILDRKLRIPKHARVFSVPGDTRVYTVSPCPDREKALVEAGISVVRIDGSGENDFLQAVFRDLAMNCYINEVLVESGPSLAGSLMRAGLVDEFVLYTAPVFLGHEGKPLLQLPGIEQMDRKVHLEYRDIRQVGPDLRLVVRPVIEKN